MISEAIETLGPPGALLSQDGVLRRVPVPTLDDPLPPGPQTVYGALWRLPLAETR